MRVRIRPLQKSDAKVSVKWRNIPELWVFTTFKTDREVTLRDEQDWIAKVISDPKSARFAILADETYVGNVYLTNIENGNAEYHIFIGEKSYWGKGVARAASVCVLDYGKKEKRLATITLKVDRANVGAYHLYSSLGFEETGIVEGRFIQMYLNLWNWDGDPRVKMG